MEILSLFNKGGLVMYPIMLASIVTITILVERWRYYELMKSNMNLLKTALPEKLINNDFAGAANVCHEVGGVVAAVLMMGINHINLPGRQSDILDGAAVHSATALKQYLNYLSVIVTLSPLLGLLGTVTGMIQSFSVLSVSSGQPFAITAGVGEALIATASGLVVAVVALLAHAFLTSRFNAIVADIEYAVTIYLTAVNGGANENKCTEV